MGMYGNNMAIKIHMLLGVSLFIGGGFVLFLLLPSVQFSHNPFDWFQPTYYEKLVPFFLVGTMLVAGVSTFLGVNKTNYSLAVFGHATSESIVLDLLGVQNAYLPNFMAYSLLPISLVVLWIAYANVLDKKKLTLAEAVSSIAVGIFLAVLPLID